jgi:hypothetical protein
MNVGDTVWTSTGVLRECTILEIYSPEWIAVTYPDLPSGCTHCSVPTALVFTTPEAALKECVEWRDYWDRQIVKLNDLLSNGIVHAVRHYDATDFPSFPETPLS